MRTYALVCVTSRRPVYILAEHTGNKQSSTRLHMTDTAGSPLPRALFVNDVGYLPDGTPMNRAGNAINHPESWFSKQDLGIVEGLGTLLVI